MGEICHTLSIVSGANHSLRVGEVRAENRIDTFAYSGLSVWVLSPLFHSVHIDFNGNGFACSNHDIWYTGKWIENGKHQRIDSRASNPIYISYNANPTFLVDSASVTNVLGSVTIEIGMLPRCRWQSILLFAMPMKPQKSSTLFSNRMKIWITSLFHTSLSSDWCNNQRKTICSDVCVNSVCGLKVLHY